MKLKAKPNNIFLLDGVGAFVTTIFLLIILLAFQKQVGMPYKLLIFLSTLAGLFTVYSLSCYFMNLRRWRPSLKAIIIANTGYCILTLLLVVYYSQQLSIWGILYFILEAIVVGAVVYLEVKLLSSNADISAGEPHL